MKYQLLIMDMDSTLINEEGIDLLAELAGIGQEVALLTTEAMEGRLDFYQSLRRRVELLKGYSFDLTSQVRDRLTLTNGAIELISSLRDDGWKIGVVSGGFHEVIDEFLAPLELDFLRANRFDVENDLFTGKLQGKIIGPTEKAGALEEFAADFGVPISATVAIGDGANDRQLLQSAALGVAFCAKQSLKEVADLSIDSRDLSLLLDELKD